MLSVRQSSLCGVPAPPAKALMMPCAWGVKPGKSTGLEALCGQSLLGTLSVVLDTSYAVLSSDDDILALYPAVSFCELSRSF